MFCCLMFYFFFLIAFYLSREPTINSDKFFAIFRLVSLLSFSNIFIFFFFLKSQLFNGFQILFSFSLVFFFLINFFSFFLGTRTVYTLFVNRFVCVCICQMRKILSEFRFMSKLYIYIYIYIFTFVLFRALTVLQFHSVFVSLNIYKYTENEPF